MSRKDIRRLRLSLGMTRRRMAELLGVSESTVGMWESGVRSPGGPSRKMLERLAKEGSAVKVDIRSRRSVRTMRWIPGWRE
ncbi:MAG: helix-turn-helix domain-containing protein [Candidatus Dormibacteria bacterium]